MASVGQGGGNCKYPLMRSGNLTDDQQSKAMPQIEPLVRALHVMRFYFQFPQLFRRQPNTVISNCQYKLIFRCFKRNTEFTALWIVLDTVLNEVVDCP